uniref:Uncharacterized protein n=1 Tax=Photinus pyralis TaxID=7054 RepID=A0A1Y1LCF5_PHOPY
MEHQCPKISKTASTHGPRKENNPPGQFLTTPPRLVRCCTSCFFPNPSTRRANQPIRFPPRSACRPKADKMDVPQATIDSGHISWQKSVELARGRETLDPCEIVILSSCLPASLSMAHLRSLEQGTLSSRFNCCRVVLVSSFVGKLLSSSSSSSSR